MAENMTPTAMATHGGARDCLARMIRTYNKTPDADRHHTAFRNMVYAFNTLLSYFRLEHDVKVEEEIEKIWEVLKGEDTGNVA